MQRVQQNQPATISASWERDGDPAVDPGDVTLTVLRDDGTELVKDAATTGTGASRAYDLTATDTATLDRLTCTWTSDDGSALTGYVEVVGGFLFTIAAARARSPLSDETAYPIGQLLAYRTMAELALEDLCGVAFVPRYRRDTARIRHHRVHAIALERTQVRRVLSVEFEGITLTDPTIAAYDDGLLERHGLWRHGAYQVRYEHGFDETPGRVARACLELARRWLVESPWDERVTDYSSGEGDRFRLLTAGPDPFDIPEVNAVAKLYAQPLVA
jgi:hypothetical protein